MKQKHSASLQSRRWRAAIVAAVLLLAIYVLIRNWPTVRRSLTAARHADGPWLFLALGLTALTFALAAAIYGVLALKRLRYRETLLVEVSTAFVNRLLPSGIGGLGVHGLYLYKRKHSAVQATVVVTANNLVGMAAHLVLLGCLVVVRPHNLGMLLARTHIHMSWVVIGVLAASACGLLALPAVRLRMTGFGRTLLITVRQLRTIQLLRALALAALLTLTYTSILFCCARSVGIGLNGLQVFVVFSFGMLASTVTPTPGGLVGAEAGLFAGFVSYGESAVPAGATVLLFRLVTYWLPLLPGVLALAQARRRGLL